MWRKTTTVVAMFALLGLGACANGGDKKDDEKATQKQGQTEEKKESDEKKGDEHPGDEHPGDKKGEEHPGDKKGDEHPGDKEGEEHPGEKGEEHPGEGAKKDKVTAKDIKMAMKSHIKKRTKEKKKGVFQIEDKKAGKKLNLKFVKIHDPVRKLEGKGYFACTDFHVSGKKKKLYDLDFWLKKKDGKLTVTKEKIHKHPAKKDGKWVKEARYTFKNDKIVKLN